MTRWFSTNFDRLISNKPYNKPYNEKLLTEIEGHTEEYLKNKNKKWINKLDTTKINILVYAIIVNRKKTCEILIKYGVDVNKEFFGYTPLDYALDEHNKEISELLIKNGADVNRIDENGFTPLTLCIYDNKNDLSEMLIKNGADVNKIDENRFTPLTLCIYKYDKNDLSEMLIKNGADVNQIDDYKFTPLTSAINYDKNLSFKMLIEKGADVNQIDGKENIPLIYAIRNNNIEIFTMLINNKKINLDIQDKDYYGRNALIHIIDYGYIEDNDIKMFKMLVDKGANVNLQDNQGNTVLLKLVKNLIEMNYPWKYSYYLNFYNIIKYLIEKGAEIKLLDKYKHHALYYAYKNEFFMMFVFLKKRAMVMNSKNNSEKSNVIKKYIKEYKEKYNKILKKRAMVMNSKNNSERSNSIEEKIKKYKEKYNEILKKNPEKDIDCLILYNEYVERFNNKNIEKLNFNKDNSEDYKIYEKMINNKVEQEKIDIKQLKQFDKFRKSGSRKYYMENDQTEISHGGPRSRSKSGISIGFRRK